MLMFMAGGAWTVVDPVAEAPAASVTVTLTSPAGRLIAVCVLVCPLLQLMAYGPIPPVILTEAEPSLVLLQEVPETGTTDMVRGEAAA